MPRRTCKIYYSSEPHEIVDKTICCSKMDDYLKLEILFLEPDELHLISSSGINHKYCPDCGARIIIKPSRL